MGCVLSSRYDSVIIILPCYCMSRNFVVNLVVNLSNSAKLDVIVLAEVLIV